MSSLIAFDRKIYERHFILIICGTPLAASAWALACKLYCGMTCGMKKSKKAPFFSRHFSKPKGHPAETCFLDFKLLTQKKNP